MRYKNRKKDTLQVAETILEVIIEIEKRIFPGINLPALDENIEKMTKILRAILHVERDKNKKTDKRSGRKPKFNREFLIIAAAHARKVLEEYFNDRVSLARFITTYLPVLKYPADIKDALKDFNINLEEARMLNRIKTDALPPGSSYGAETVRKMVLNAHLKRQGSQNDLRRKVEAKLGISASAIADAVSVKSVEVVEISDELLKWNEFDTDHLFWEEIKDLVFLLRDVDTEKINPEEMNVLLNDIENLKLRLFKYRFD